MRGKSEREKIKKRRGEISGKTRERERQRVREKKLTQYESH